MPTDPNQLDALHAVQSTPVTSDHAGLIQRILTWLRAGYPQGVPQEDYVALLGVLHRQLTDAEVQQVVDTLVADRPAGEPITADEVRHEVKSQVLEHPSPEDLARVHAHLAAGGWPLADIGATPPAAD